MAEEPGSVVRFFWKNCNDRHPSLRRKVLDASTYPQNGYMLKLLEGRAASTYLVLCATQTSAGDRKLLH